MERGDIKPGDIERGDIAALARAITLVESTNDRHRQAANTLLEAIGPEKDNTRRLGFTGPPGAGKSTLIDQFGTWLCARGHRVAVLAIDPSSTRTSGSILGDKTRMASLVAERRAYVRPSPSRGTLGGVARATREAMLLCEAAGFDVVIIETVGVGQSETTVAELVDSFCVLLPPGGGDDLQGIKKGLIELADLLVVTKADGDLQGAAQRAERDLRAALHILGMRDHGWSVPVNTVSALQKEGFEALWHAIEQHHQWGVSTGQRHQRRAEQRLSAFRRGLSDRALHAFMADDALKASVQREENRVASGEVAPGVAVDHAIGLLVKRISGSTAKD